MKNFNEQNLEICVVLSESVVLKHNIARGTKRKFLLFQIAYNIDDLFKVTQNYH